MLQAILVRSPRARCLFARARFLASVASAVEGWSCAYLCQQLLAEVARAVVPNVAAICVDDVRLAMAYGRERCGTSDKKSPPSVLRTKRSLPARICCALFLTATSRTP